MGERACGRRWAGVGARAGAATSWARGRKAQRACRAGGRAAGRARAGGARGRLGARGAVAGARGAAAGARGSRLGGQYAPGCAQLGQVGVLCTLTQFLARFDSVLFLSH